jgi:hypothetical protein
MIRNIIRINAVVAALLAAFFLIYPPLRAGLDLADPALRQPGIPKAAWRLYRSLTPRYAAWARERVARGRAAGLSTNDISGTEWPLFGSVFYLWGLENLQAAWEAGDHTAGLEPRVFAKDAILAASELVIDPQHASWVREHWGADYLHRENVFYRMLVIAALASREKLLHDAAHPDLLRDQVETLAKELDASGTGLLDDYPGECYPGDVMAALMCIKRADAVLGTDHSAMLNRALRAFIGTRATSQQLPPYAAGSATGLPASDARGCANSYVCLTAPELWPAQARRWFACYDRFFWQQRITAVGFREFPKGTPHSEWGLDVDAGLIVAGHGVAASAFGVGAARKNGRFDRAYPLAAEMLATVGELPNGVLAAPALMSNLSDAPRLGEAAILWQLSIQPEKGARVTTGGSLPGYVYIVLTAALLLGVWQFSKAVWSFGQARRQPLPAVAAPGLQAAVWACVMAGAVVLLAAGHGLAGILALVAAQMLPIVKRRPSPKRVQKPPEPAPAAASVAATGNPNTQPSDEHPVQRPP